MKSNSRQITMKMVADLRAGRIKHPPEIVALQKEIKLVTDAAEIFEQLWEVVPETMVIQVVEMKRRLDTLCAAWIEDYSIRQTLILP